MNPASPVPAPTRRWQSWRWALLTLVAIALVASIGTYLTTSRPGPAMDPASTGPDGAHALTTLLREHGVEVVVANNVADAESAARPDSLLLVAQTHYLTDHALLERLARTPGSLLLVEPTSRARDALTPGLRLGTVDTLNDKPNCALREANRAGSVYFGSTDTYVATGNLTLTSCYDGALVRYNDGSRTITVVGSSLFMTNGGLSREGNAALAMNLAGDQPRVIWFAPHHTEGKNPSPASFSDLIPENVTWIVWQLWLVVILVALWKSRRIGPLVAEELPVIVRASETVEGRGRLYRSRRARDRAADALRTAALQRLLPRLGLDPNTPAPAVVTTVAQRTGAGAEFVSYHLFGPPPATDNDLLQLARVLDDIERQVTHS